MKKTAVALLLSVMVLIAGCAEEEGALNKVKPASLLKKQKQSKPLSLSQVLASGTLAFNLTTSTVDRLGDDKFLRSVIEAKQRDETERLKTQTVELAASVAEAESDSEVEEAGASSGSSSDGSSGGQSSPTTSEPAPGGSSTPSTTTQTPTDSDRYYNTSQGFSIVFPKGWEKKDLKVGDSEGVAAVSPIEGATDEFLENMTVGAEDLVLALTVDEYLQLSLEGLSKTLTDFDKISKENVMLDGQDARKVIYSYTTGDYKIKVLMYLTVKGFQGYAITCSSDAGKFSEYESTFGTAAQSFNFE